MKYLIFLFLFFIYLFFPTNNSVNDAYSYAASIKWGEELFHPHHLLYNITGYIFFKITSFLGLNVSVLPLMKIINAFFGLLNLLLLWKILRFLQVDKHKKYALILFAGSSFAVMRFATENETYIIPVFFSLLGSFYFIIYIYEQKNIQLLLSSLFGSLACLYHQVHVFWWMGILVAVFIFFRENKPGIVWYVLAAFIVPVFYSLVLVFVLNKDLISSNFFAFVFAEFYKGNTATGIGSNNFILTGISFIRVFIQVHGNLFLFVKSNFLFILPAILFFILFLYGIIKMKRAWLGFRHRQVFITHLIIFFLQLLFAFYALGNQEFMVMIPFLAAILLACVEQVKAFSLLCFSLGMLVWNLSYAILPNHFYEYTANKELRRLVLNNQDKLFILNDKNQLSNEIYYFIHKRPDNIFSCPSTYAMKKKGFDELQSKMAEVRKNGLDICTDCIGNEEAFDRAALLKGDADEKFFESYTVVPYDTLRTQFGRKIIYKVAFKSLNTP